MTDILNNLRETIAVYFANVYYFNLYKSAEQHKKDSSSRSQSIKDSYIHVITEYEKAIRTREAHGMMVDSIRQRTQFVRLVETIRGNFHRFSGTDIPFNNFMQALFDSVVPPGTLTPQQLNSFNEENIDGVVYSVITKSLAMFNGAIIDGYMHPICDITSRNDKDRSNAIMIDLKMKFSQTYELERANLIKAIISGQNGYDASEITNRSTYGSVLSAHQAKITELLQDKANLISQYNGLVEKWKIDVKYLTDRVDLLTRENSQLMMMSRLGNTPQPVQHQYTSAPDQDDIIETEIVGSNQVESMNPFNPGRVGNVNQGGVNRGSANPGVVEPFSLDMSEFSDDKIQTDL